MTLRWINTLLSNRDAAREKDKDFMGGMSCHPDYLFTKTVWKVIFTTIGLFFFLESLLQWTCNNFPLGAFKQSNLRHNFHSNDTLAKLCVYARSGTVAPDCLLSYSSSAGSNSMMKYSAIQLSLSAILIQIYLFMLLPLLVLRDQKKKKRGRAKNNGDITIYVKNEAVNAASIH